MRSVLVQDWLNSREKNEEREMECIWKVERDNNRKRNQLELDKKNIHNGRVENLDRKSKVGRKENERNERKN